MDELLQKALERRAQLRKELEAVDRLIQTYSAIKDQRPKVGHPDLFDAPVARRRGRAKEIEAAMDAAEKMILDAGRPLTRSALLRMLDDAGHRVEGADRSKVLGTNLWRSKRFHNLKGAGYWPISRPIPAEFADLTRRQSMLLGD